MRGRAVPLLTLVLLLAGCLEVSETTFGGSKTRTLTQSIVHDYRRGEVQTIDLEFPYPGELRFEVNFRGMQGLPAGMHVCPSDPDVALEVLDAQGQIVESVEPDIHGVNGTGGCGVAQREVDVREPGIWTLRFRGQAEMSVDGELRVWSSTAG